MIIIERDISTPCKHREKVNLALDFCEVCHGTGKVLDLSSRPNYNLGPVEHAECVNCDGTGFICTQCDAASNACCCRQWIFP
jgi:hypothetical protein